MPPDRPLEGKPYPPDRLHPRLYGAELIGTGLLVAIGLSVVILFFGSGSPVAAAFPSAGLRRLIAGALFGFTGALITISPIGRISGAHLNPSVTLAFWLEGKLVWRDAFGYWLAQLGGAMLGAIPLLAWGRLGASVNFGATLPGAQVSSGGALAGEVVATVALILVIFFTSAHPRIRHLTPWTIPPLFAWLVWWEGPVSGASTNLARSLGPALISGQWQDFWIYIVGPLAGSALAVAILRFEVIGRHRVTVARLFHSQPDRRRRL